MSWEVYLCKVNIVSLLFLFFKCAMRKRGLPGGSVVKNPPANAGDVSLIPGGEVPLETKMATYSGIFPWEIPWTEEPGMLQTIGSKRVEHD